MSESHRVGDLEIAENLAFVQWQWRLQRIGLRLMLLTVLLALAGLFGSGPLSSAERQTPDGALTVGYHRFIRHDGNTTLTIEAHGRHAENTEVEI